MSRDRDFIKWRSAFMRGRGYHRAYTYGNQRHDRYVRWACFCGWKGDSLAAHYQQIKPQRDLYCPTP